MDDHELAAPVSALFAAIETRDRDTVATTMTGDVRFELPSIGFSCTGRDAALDALGTVLVAFPDFRYRVRSRYVAPGHVIDEAVLSGTRSGPLLNSPPTDRAGTVPARVMLAHDGSRVTAVTLWADAGALRELVDLPASAPGTTAPLVTALRATLPTAEGRVFLARDRETAAVPTQPPAPPPLPKPRISPTRTADLKVPVPRRIRRLQAGALALLMVAASAGLVAWVVHGTVNAATTTAPSLPVTDTTTWTATATRPVGTTAEASVPLRFDSRRNEYEFSSDLLFDTDSSRLTPQARDALQKVIARIRAERRWGRITVTGYTDQRGAASYNLRLSQERAAAVADALRRGLSDLLSQVSVTAVGRGEADPVARGTSPEALAENRRVTVQVPAPR